MMEPKTRLFSFCPDFSGFFAKKRSYRGADKQIFIFYNGFIREVP